MPICRDGMVVDGVGVFVVQVDVVIAWRNWQPRAISPIKCATVFFGIQGVSIGHVASVRAARLWTNHKDARIGRARQNGA